MAGRIAVIGSCMIDLVTYVTRMPDAGETLVAPRFEIGFGGKGANQAVACARLGSEVMMLAKVGDDEFGASTLANFAAEGIDCRFVERVSGISSGVAPIFVEPDGQNRILIVKGANDRLLPADIDRAAAALSGCALLLLQLEVPLETVYHAIAWARRHDIPVLLNPAPANPELALARLHDVRFFMPNQTELALLTGQPVATVPQAAAAARTLLAAGLAHVIVTLGGEGALWVTRDDTDLIPPLPVVPVDTTGAGDAFIGSFAHHYVQRGQGEEKGAIAAALAAAARYAAQSITARGTQRSFPSAAAFATFRPHKPS
jgi:ribokinase